MKKYTPKLGCELPDTWPTLEAFTDWYMEDAGMPILPPFDSEIIVSDNATSMTLFRHGRFQVEVYLLFPRQPIRQHAHPGISTIIVTLGGGNQGKPSVEGVSSVWGERSFRVDDMEVHGGGGNLVMGGNSILSFQHWADGLEITSDAVRWKGITAGPLQESLIKRHYPDAYVVSGYADVTRKAED